MKYIGSLTTWVSALLLGLMLTFTALAQTNRAQIQGLITDSTGATVPDATVTLSNTKTGVNTVRKTSNTGLYVFDLVEPGVYVVTVEATGFPKFTQSNISGSVRRRRNCKRRA